MNIFKYEFLILFDHFFLLILVRSGLKSSINEGEFVKKFVLEVLKIAGGFGRGGGGGWYFDKYAEGAHPSILSNETYLLKIFYIVSKFKKMSML